MVDLAPTTGATTAPGTVPGRTISRRTGQLDRPLVPITPRATARASTPGARARDPRRLAVAALGRFAAAITTFTIVGHLWLGFEQAPITPIATLGFAYVLAITLELLSSWSKRRRPAWSDGALAAAAFFLPVHITALATAMLLYANSSLWPYLFAVSIAFGSKYLLRVRVCDATRHVFNPSNTGIAVTLLLFPWVGIAPPYQYTARVDGALDWIVPAAVLFLGSMLNIRLTGRAPLIVAWLGGFVAQAAVRTALFGAALVPSLVPLTGMTMVLYTNYMITDPGTTPSSVRGQVAFGLSNAAIYGTLVALHVSFGLFFALVLTCAGRGLLLAIAARRRR